MSAGGYGIEQGMLYHGTDAEHIDDIFEEGLKPRQTTGRSNWSHSDMESIPNHVYLSRLYGIYFGKCAVENPFEEDFAVFEIDVRRLNHDQLYPDEDYIVMAIRDDIIDLDLGEKWEGASLKEKTRAIRNQIAQFQSYWDASLAQLGNISYRGTIPPGAIRKASHIHDPPMEFVTALDPTISIMNARVLGPKYEWYTNLIFDKDVSLDDYRQIEAIPEDLDDLDEEARELHESRLEKGRDLIEGDFWTVRENPNY